MQSRSFFAELKWRTAIRMAGLYLVGVWLLTQVATTPGSIEVRTTRKAGDIGRSQRGSATTKLAILA